MSAYRVRELGAGDSRYFRYPSQRLVLKADLRSTFLSDLDPSLNLGSATK